MLSSGVGLVVLLVATPPDLRFFNSSSNSLILFSNSFSFMLSILIHFLTMLFIKCYETIRIIQRKNNNVTCTFCAQQYHTCKILLSICSLGVIPATIF